MSTRQKKTTLRIGLSLTNQSGELNSLLVLKIGGYTQMDNEYLTFAN